MEKNEMQKTYQQETETSFPDIADMLFLVSNLSYKLEDQKPQKLWFIILSNELLNKSKISTAFGTVKNSKSI